MTKYTFLRHQSINKKNKKTKQKKKQNKKQKKQKKNKTTTSLLLFIDVLSDIQFFFPFQTDERNTEEGRNT